MEGDGRNFLTYRLKIKVENTGVTFVKGANERNKFFEKKNKQSVMYGEQVGANTAKD